MHSPHPDVYLFVHPPLQLLDLCPFAKFFVSALECSCSFNHLVHYQAKLLQLQQHVLQGSSLATREQLAGSPSLIKVCSAEAAFCVRPAHYYRKTAVKHAGQVMRLPYM